MSNLYRFISFPSFVNLVEQQTERYVLPSTWEDTYEGYLLHVFKRDASTAKILQTLMDNLSQGNPKAAISNYLKLFAARWLCYGQCWTTMPESDAFWRIYSYNKMAIRIETDEYQIKKLFEASEIFEKYHITIDNVQYDLDPDGQAKSINELMDDIHKTARVTEPFFHKRKAFEHEYEKRIMLLDNSKYVGCVGIPLAMLPSLFLEQSNVNCDAININVIADEVKKLSYPFSNDEIASSVNIPIPDIRAYIKSVMVHPQADKWIVDLVEKICQRTGLHFAGQSLMYKGLS